MKNKIPTSFFSTKRFGVIAVIAFFLVIVSVIFISELNRNPFKEFPDAVIHCKWGNVTKFVSQNGTPENISSMDTWQYCTDEECHSASEFFKECNNKGVKLKGDLRLSMLCPSCHGSCGCKVLANIMGVSVAGIDEKLLEGGSYRVLKDVTVEGVLSHNGESNYAAGLNDAIIY